MVDDWGSPRPGTPIEQPGSDGTRPRMGWHRQVRRLFVIVLLGYVGVTVLVGCFQSRLIYFPSRGYSATPIDVGLPFEDLTLTTADGVSIAAWYVPCGNARGSLIFCHGNAGNMSDRLHSIKLLHEMGLNVLIFDYRGFGRSTGRPNEEGTYEDAAATWRHLVEKQGEAPDRLILFGRSLGGAVAIELARRLEEGEPSKRPAALVVESTFTNLVDIGRLHYPFLPVRLLLTYRYDSLSKVPRITCPKLFIHGRDDGLIPFENGRRLFDAAAEPKQLFETPGDHNEAGFTYSREFADRMKAFVCEALPQP